MARSVNSAVCQNPNMEDIESKAFVGEFYIVVLA
jgi:hypothetical protein